MGPANEEPLLAKDKNEEDLKCGDKVSRQWQSFKVFLYNPAEGTVMGRTGTSWAKIGFFYLIFYGFLAGFFSGMLAIFMTTVDQPGEGGPKLTQFIENKPGLTRIDSKSKLRNFDSNSQKDISFYGNLTKSFFDGYNTSDHSGFACGTTQAKNSDKLCSFNLALLGDCNPKTNPKLGLNIRKPCIYIRVNKVFGWVPHDDGSGYLKLTCEGKGVTVRPDGFQIAAFPFKGEKAYQPPIVSVQIDTSKGSSGNVDCKLSGKNIKVSDSFNPTRSFGNIRIEGISSK